MKKSALIYVFALLSGIILYSCKPNDQKLQKSVETALTTAKTPSAVTSTVKDGIVTLTGTVQSEEAKMAAEQAAKAIKDVKSVVNNIEVKLPAPTVVINPDDTLTSTIKTALTTGGFNDVAVTVKDGEVTLTGDVKRADLAKVMQIANESNPKKIINQLNIK